MDILDRLFDHLKRAVQRERIGRAPTIGDVYQRLVPYRAIRSELGVWELAEYEHALLRLLSGERAYVSLSGEEARQEMVRELASPNPILGIYRDYSSVPVEILADSPSPDGAFPPHAPEGPEKAEAFTTLPEDSLPTEGGCPVCESPLPATPDLRFCPACGADQRALHCSGCRAVLKPDWNFCIRCGKARHGTDPALQAG